MATEPEAKAMPRPLAAAVGGAAASAAESAGPAAPAAAPIIALPQNIAELAPGGPTQLPPRLPKLPPDMNTSKYILQWVLVGTDGGNDATRRRTYQREGKGKGSGFGREGKGWGSGRDGGPGREGKGWGGGKGWWGGYRGYRGGWWGGGGGWGGGWNRRYRRSHSRSSSRSSRSSSGSDASDWSAASAAPRPFPLHFDRIGPFQRRGQGGAMAAMDDESVTVNFSFGE